MMRTPTFAATAITPVCSNNAPSYEAYHALVNAVWTTSNQGNNWEQKGFNNDMGPILWPGNGFLDASNGNASQGLAQPASIYTGDYIYVFIWDEGPRSVPATEGRTRGIKVVRALTADCLDPTKYEVYYKDPLGNEQWLPSLPAGFTKETMMSYLHTQGPKSTDVLTDQIADNTYCFRFSAAKVNNTNYYIGLEEFVDNNDMGGGGARHHLALRFSIDLVNWSAREKIIETSNNWDASSFNYAIFLSADGWSNTAVDLNNFYVIGTHSQTPFRNPIFMMNFTYSPAIPQKVSASALSVFGTSFKEGSGSAAVVTEELDISGLAKGAYFVRILAGAEQKTYKVLHN
ncbi:MAG TPA: T9SS type A sorting domain-containing protein [Puia sp.]|jgi:hypothetical protein